METLATRLIALEEKLAGIIDDHCLWNVCSSPNKEHPADHYGRIEGEILDWELKVKMFCVEIRADRKAREKARV